MQRPGTSFGESVFFMFGERSATVCAYGCARAYGISGKKVRKLLSAQYGRMIVDMDEADRDLATEIDTARSFVSRRPLSGVYKVGKKAIEAPTVYCRDWGRDFSGGDSSWVRDELQNVQQICATSFAVAAILADGTMVTWGDEECLDDSLRVSRVQDQLQNVHADVCHIRCFRCYFVRR
eukprot:s2663_g7.t1